MFLMRYEKILFSRGLKAIDFLLSAPVRILYTLGIYERPFQTKRAIMGSVHEPPEKRE